MANQEHTNRIADSSRSELLAGVKSQSPTSQAYDELDRAYQHFNHELFEGKLEPCLLTFSRSKKYAGYYAPKRFVNKVLQKMDEISLNPGLFAVNAVEDVLSTLVHEMVHKQQHDFFSPSRRGYHNREWGELMMAVGLCPSHNGEPGGNTVGEKMTHYIIAGGRYQQSVAKLLETNFGIIWFDREITRTVVRKPKPLPIQIEPLENPGDEDGVTNPAQEPTDGSEQPNAGTPGVDGPATEPPSSPAPPIKAEPSIPPCDAVEGLDLVDPHTKPVNKSLRLKYKCGGVDKKHQVWGKPGLQLFCKACNADMVCDESSTMDEKAQPDAVELDPAVQQPDPDPAEVNGVADQEPSSDEVLNPPTVEIFTY